MSRWTPTDRTALVRHGVLAVNIHRIPPENRDEATRRFRALARLGPALDLDVTTRPGRSVFVGFYDGYRDTSLWGADVCSALGLRAWFFPIFQGRIPGQAGLDDRDLAELAERHELGFHSHSHVSAAEVTEATLAREVTEPLDRLTAITGRAPRLGAWRGGARFDESQPADRALRAGGVTHLVSNWSIEQIPDRRSDQQANGRSDGRPGQRSDPA